MFKAWFSRRQEELLPWYANGTLTAAEREAVERWLRQSPEAPDKLAGWQQLRAVVTDQVQQTPPSSVWWQVMARTKDATRRQTQTLPRLTWAWGTVLAATILILMWGTIQPGIVLQWSVNSGPLTTFRVYRAPAGSPDFDLVQEVAVRPDVQQYTYVDAALWPAQTYVYRIEGVGQGRQSALSQAITASALDALPAQLAVLLTSLIAGYGTVILAQRWRLSQASWRVSGLLV